MEQMNNHQFAATTTADVCCALARRTYQSPTVTMVEFAVEIGQTASTFKITAVDYTDHYSETEANGTEAYETSNRGGDFF